MIAFIPTYGATGSGKHHLNPALLEHGHVWTRRVMERRYQRGGRRFLLHLPVGRDQSKMLFTDWLDADEDARVGAVAASLVPQVSVFLDEHDQAHVYIYLGSPWLDQAFRDQDIDEQADTAERVLAPVFELSARFPGRVSLALDHAHVIPITDPLAMLMLTWQRRLGVPLVVEGGVSVQAWQSEAGFGRLMIWSSFGDRLETPLQGWEGEQILLPNPAGQFRWQAKDWRKEMESLGFTTCGY